MGLGEVLRVFVIFLRNIRNFLTKLHHKVRFNKGNQFLVKIEDPIRKNTKFAENIFSAFFFSV